MGFMDRLKLIMQSHGDDMGSLAHKAGIPYVAIVGLFNRGWERTDALTVWRICDHYNVSVDYMVTGKNR